MIKLDPFEALLTVLFSAMAGGGLIKGNWFTVTASLVMVIFLLWAGLLPFSSSNDETQR